MVKALWRTTDARVDAQPAISAAAVVINEMIMISVVEDANGPVR